MKATPSKYKKAAEKEKQKKLAIQKKARGKKK